MVNMLSIVLKSPKEIQLDLASKIRQVRLSENLSQEGLSVRSGVSLGSIKRFERTGEISLGSLISIAVALGLSRDFEALFAHDEFAEGSLFAAKETKKRQRGTIK